ncbi:MAG TPA: thioredoxin family protein [Kiritimatiellia bacterium]|nr:thioredoxin family protein [Kiritimatiellia bacterium]
MNPSLRSASRFSIVPAMVMGLGLVLLAGCGRALERTVAEGLPTLMEFGSDKCHACQQMKPVIDGLREEFAGQLEVIMVDVWADPDRAEAHGIERIPTQIFKDGRGRELHRHTGMLSREEIVKVWSDLGYSL